MGSARRRPRRATALAGVVAGLVTIVGSAQAQGNPQSSPDDGGRSAEPLYVEVSHGLVTVRARDAMTGDILDAIARASGLRIVSDFELVERTSVDIVEQPLPKALQLILRGQSFALRHVPTESGEGRSAQMQTSTLWLLHEQGRGGTRPRNEVQQVEIEADAGIGAQQIALNDPDVEVRLDAIMALAEIGGEEVVPLLGFALNDTEQEVRLEAVAALAEVATDSAASALAAAVSDGDEEIRHEALWAIAEIGGSTSVALLQENLSHPEKDLREAAIEGLAHIGGEESARALGVALQDADPELREGAVNALGEIGNEEAVRMLQQALSDGDPAIRSAAADVLDELSELDTTAQ